MSDSKFRFVSDCSTQAGTKRSDSDGYSWSTYSGTKDSHDVQVDQMNSKDYEGISGSHKFYSPKSGSQGVAGPNYERNKK